MKKGIYYGLLVLGALSLASCGHQKSAADKAASAKAESSQVAASKASASSKAASLKLKRIIASSAKKEAESASRESIAAASSSKAASESEAQASMAKAQSESAETAAKAASESADQHATADLPESVATGTQVDSLDQAVSLVRSKLGTGDQDNPITWTTMTAGSDTFEGDDGQAYYWIRGIRQSSLEAQKRAGAGSADGLDYYVYQNGLIRSRDAVDSETMASMMDDD